MAEQPTFGQRNFGKAKLGDVRRTKRLVRIADQMAHRPGGSLTEKINSPKDLKAMYRLMDCPDVTHDSALNAHQEHLFEDVLPAQSGFTLLISDATEMEYTGRESIANRLGQNRNCLAGHHVEDRDAVLKLHDQAREQESLGSWDLEVTRKSEFKSPKRKGKKRKVVRKKRTATMHVSATPVSLKASRAKSSPLIEIWVLRVWEANPPRGQERLEWFLMTNHEIKTFDDAWQVVEWYEARWVIEEYHKCLKTGMQIEGYQFTDTDRLEPAIALTSVTAITLLNLRDDSRDEATKDRQATEYLDVEYIEILSMWRHGKVRLDWTVAEFVLALARLSGHQNRKSDHPPGWQKLWKGWHELHAMIVGARFAKQIKKCG